MMFQSKTPDEISEKWKNENAQCPHEQRKELKALHEYSLGKLHVCYRTLNSRRKG